MLKRILATLTLAIMTAPALAAEPIMGAGIFCDTAEQAEAIARAYSGSNAQEALAAVSAQHGERACVPATVALRWGDEVGRVKSHGKTYAIKRALIVGVRHPAGFMIEPEKPVVWFTLMLVEEDRGA